MFTDTDIATMALRRLGAINAVEPAGAEDLAFAFDALEMVLAIQRAQKRVWWLESDPVPVAAAHAISRLMAAQMASTFWGSDVDRVGLFVADGARAEADLIQLYPGPLVQQPLKRVTTSA